MYLLSSKGTDSNKVDFNLSRKCIWNIYIYIKKQVPNNHHRQYKVREEGPKSEKQEL